MTELEKIGSSFRLTSLASMLGIGFSVLTTKIIAVTLGPTGVGLMGLYRTFGGFVGRALQIGFDSVLIQRISTASATKEKTALVEATVLLLGIEAVLLLCVALFLDTQIARWLVGAEGSAHVVEIRIVLLMALFNTALQFGIGILSGSIKVKHVVLVNLATAGSSLLLIYPLLAFGQTGLAINVGSGAIAGLLVAAAIAFREYRPSLSPATLGARWPLLRATLQRSGYLLIHPTLVAGCILVAQSLIARVFGLSALGEYTAALTITETALLVLMSSVRSHIFPALGQFSDEIVKQRFLVKALGMLVSASAAAAAIIIALAPYLPALLFSSEFVRATELTMVLSITVLAQSFLYPFNAFLLHKAAYGWAFALDSVWAAMMLGSVYASVFTEDGLRTFVWLNAIAYSLSAAMYWGSITYLFGRSHLPHALGIQCLGLLALLFGAAFLSIKHPGMPASLALAALLGGAAIFWMRRRKA